MIEQTFHGCKVALFVGERLLIILRDDKPDIPWPNLWDFPGGRREGEETPQETLIREVWEEVGLTLVSKDLIWKKGYPASFDPSYRVIFFVAKLPASAEAEVVFGNEGQGWKLVDVAEYLAMDRIIPNYPDRLRDWADCNPDCLSRFSDSEFRPALGSGRHG